ncbi:hypothetical protein B0H16DRAFT_1484226 [Mycena metata]|uniref:DDE Tnp4 domain-containing protein n=1 Tax=Mycena metata TaxID=1033252 RepID=A0AAD7DVS9_9AGAR|nr:hypothetical protein B0H16DRAFT_1484226 [Mycena metata]
MPRLSSRRECRARDVLKTFLEYHTSRLKAVLRRKNKFKRNFARAGLAPEDIEELNTFLSPAQIFETVSINMTSGASSGTGSSIDSSISSGLSSNGSESSLDWSDLLGSDWRGSSASTSTDTSTDSLFDASDSMPDLHPLGYPDSDEEDDAVTSDSSETTTSTASSGGEGDDEGGWGGELGPEDNPGYGGSRVNNCARWVRHNLEEMYSARYELPRDTFPHPPGPSLLRHTLGALKDTRPDLFRQEVRMSPFTFDKIVKELAGDPVFANNSSNGQMPVEDQLAITLYRFGHSGNAAALQKVANWAGVGKGTITLVTRRVMTAILNPDFMAAAVCMPTAVEKEEAKSWVEAHSCRAWRDGWCMVDGTLVALFDRPFWFGESYFDRKCNYSLNVQVRIHY